MGKKDTIDWSILTLGKALVDLFHDVYEIFGTYSQKNYLNPLINISNK